MAYYLESKGCGGSGGHTRKSKSETFLTQDQVDGMLTACEKARDNFNPHWKRDYAMLFMAYYFALRIGETIILERRHFEHLEDLEVASIPTLKRYEKVGYSCSCGRQCKVKAERIGQIYPCPKCGKPNEVRCPQGYIGSDNKEGIEEVDPPVIEGQVVAFVVDYIKKYMRPDQKFLFESKRGRHVSISKASRIFSTYAIASGLSNHYSWHSLRHGRGVKLWTLFKDLKMVADGLRHSGMKTAERYTHLDPETVRGYKDKLEKVAINPMKKR